MATYGTAVVIDSPNENRLTSLAQALATETIADLYRSTLPDGWTRMVLWLSGIEEHDRVSTLLSHLGIGRAAIAEDYDEFGAAWSVLAAEDALVRTVHRRYVLGGDPTDPADIAAAIDDLDGEDPRAGDVTGDQAAVDAAALFGVHASGMLAADALATTSDLIDGSVGGPFPWWDALNLPWPGDGAGDPLPPAASSEAIRMNRATWPRFATRHVIPRLTDPDEWTVTPFGAARGETTWLLQGVSCSRNSSGFDIRTIVMPLYVPFEHLILTWSHERLYRHERWYFHSLTQDAAADTGAVVAAQVNGVGVRYLDQAGHLDGFLDLLMDARASTFEATGHPDAHAEEIGYTLVLLGRHDEAVTVLADVRKPTRRASERDREKARRIRLVRRLLAKNPQLALDRLDEWAQHTADAIGVERTPYPS